MPKSIKAFLIANILTLLGVAFWTGVIYEQLQYQIELSRRYPIDVQAAQIANLQQIISNYETRLEHLELRSREDRYFK